MTARDVREMVDAMPKTTDSPPPRTACRRAATCSVPGLIAALREFDADTGAHSGEVVRIALRVAHRLGLSHRDVRLTELTAALHDVGKVGIPLCLLRKPGPLTEGEWSQMRTHTVVGERIVRSISGLDGVAKAVRHEHERWDGTGYPDGLQGAEIPIASRIVLVCDAYHAMRSSRPYQPERSDAEARAELLAGAGGQFDPGVVDALIAVLDDPAPRR